MSGAAAAPAESAAEPAAAAAARDGFACPNPKCMCRECTCGEGCTCNVSQEVTCDPCIEFKASKMAAAAAVAAAEPAVAVEPAAVAPPIAGVEIDAREERWAQLVGLEGEVFT
eukprot:SAG11_NODE_2079_length_3855_cov_1.533280_2_plen_113_part_00